MIFVNFHLDDEDETPVIGFLVDVVPRVGEEIGYSFCPAPEERVKYSDDGLDHRDRIKGKSWTVARVAHELREHRLGLIGGRPGMQQNVFVFLKPKD